MIRAAVIAFILALGIKAAFAVHDMTQRIDAQRVAILKGAE